MTDSLFLYHCKLKKQVSHGKNLKEQKNSTIENAKMAFLMVKPQICHRKMSTNKENPSQEFDFELLRRTNIYIAFISFQIYATPQTTPLQRYIPPQKV